MKKRISVISEQGSIMIEAAIIFPLVLLVLFGLLSGILVLHDRFVTEMTLEVYGNSSTKEEIYTELNKKRIAGSNQLSFEIEAGKLSTNGKISVSDETNYPLGNLYPFKKTYTVDYQEPKSLERILAIELTNDLIDSITLPEEIQKNFDGFVKNIFGSLESY